MTILAEILADQIELLKRSGFQQSIEIEILKALMLLSQDLDTKDAQNKDLLNQILNQFLTPDLTPVSLRFVVIRTRNIQTGEWTNMPQSLINDQISNIPLEFDNLAGQKVAPPAGTLSFTVTDDATSTPSTTVTVALGADGSSVDVTPVPADGTNLNPGFTISAVDSAGAGFNATLDCNFTNDPNAANAHFVTTGITTRPVGP